MIRYVLVGMFISLLFVGGYTITAIMNSREELSIVQGFK